MFNTIKRLAIFPVLFLSTASLNGCSVMAVADAAVTVGATAVKAGAAVVGTAVDATTAVAKKVGGSGEGKEPSGEMTTIVKTEPDK